MINTKLKALGASGALTVLFGYVAGEFYSAPDPWYGAAVASGALGLLGIVVTGDLFVSILEHTEIPDEKLNHTETPNENLNYE